MLGGVASLHNRSPVIDRRPGPIQPRPRPIEHLDRCRRTAMLVTTTPGIKGRTVTQYLGVVTTR
jgi:hypothetical protein